MENPTNELEFKEIDTTEKVENLCTLIGEVISAPEKNHETHGENFYIFKLKIDRLSGDMDIIDIIVSEKLIDISTILIGDFFKIEGEIRSYNHYISESEKRKLIINIFAKNILKVTSEEDLTTNNIQLIGHICKQPIYRKTPFGREIADILLAVNRLYGKSDYLPCIAWGRNAKYASKFQVGDKIKLIGRIQSSEYVTKIEDKEIKKVAYEISVASLEKIQEEINE